MAVPRDAVFLRIFFGESDRFGRQALYEAVVLKARDLHLAGATVLRGSDGIRTFEEHSHGEDSEAFVRPANRRRDHRHREENQRFPAGARLDDGDRTATLEKVQIRQYGMEEPEESVALA
jgi:uncharacterized protein